MARFKTTALLLLVLPAVAIAAPPDEAELRALAEHYREGIARTRARSKAVNSVIEKELRAELEEVRRSTAYDDENTRRDKVREQKEKLEKHREKAGADSHALIPYLGDGLDLGSVGKLTKVRNHVVQVLSPDEAIIKTVIETVKVDLNGHVEARSNLTDLVVRGVPTQGMAPEQHIFLDQMFQVTGDREFTNPSGAPVKLRVIEPVNVEAFRPYLLDTAAASAPR